MDAVLGTLFLVAIGIGGMAGLFWLIAYFRNNGDF